MEEKYKDHFQKGVYKCSNCGAILFDSDSKFDSGTRWPSFRKMKGESVKRRIDESAGMVREEILCSRCGSHLGHVFPDGKQCGDNHPEAGARFCVLSDSLKFDQE